MRGLFLRIYTALGVALLLGILLVASLGKSRPQDWTRELDAVAEFPAEVTRELAGAVTMPERRAVLDRLASATGHPVDMLPRAAARARLDDVQQLRMGRGETVVVGTDRDATVFVPLSTEPFVVVMGPIPFSTDADLRPLGLAALLMLLVASVPWMLRPLDRELRSLTQTADELGEGNLDVRAPIEPGSTTLAVATSFNGMADQVQRLLRTQRDLMHAVSHELRTPLQRMRFAVDLLPHAGASLQERAQGLQDDVDELDTLVDELLSWSSLQSTETAARRIEVDVVELLEGLVHAARRLRPHIEFSLETDVGSCQLDEAGTRRAVGNLINNAARYTQSRVAVRASTVGDALRIVVEDDGDGVPLSDRERIFEPFVRLDAARSRDTGGIGLGLALTRQWADKHAGTVHVEDSPLGGASFVWSVIRTG